MSTPANPIIGLGANLPPGTAPNQQDQTQQMLALLAKLAQAKQQQQGQRGPATGAQIPGIPGVVASPTNIAGKQGTPMALAGGQAKPSVAGSGIPGATQAMPRNPGGSQAIQTPENNLPSSFANKQARTGAVAQQLFNNVINQANQKKQQDFEKKKADLEYKLKLYFLAVENKDYDTANKIVDDNWKEFHKAGMDLYKYQTQQQKDAEAQKQNKNKKQPQMSPELAAVQAATADRAKQMTGESQGSGSPQGGQPSQGQPGSNAGQPSMNMQGSPSGAPNPAQAQNPQQKQNLLQMLKAKLMGGQGGQQGNNQQLPQPKTLTMQQAPDDVIKQMIQQRQIQEMQNNPEYLKQQSVGPLDTDETKAAARIAASLQATPAETKQIEVANKRLTLDEKKMQQDQVQFNAQLELQNRQLLQQQKLAESQMKNQADIEKMRAGPEYARIKVAEEQRADMQKYREAVINGNGQKQLQLASKINSDAAIAYEKQATELMKGSASASPKATDDPAVLDLKKKAQQARDLADKAQSGIVDKDLLDTMNQ